MRKLAAITLCCLICLPVYSMFAANNADEKTSNAWLKGHYVNKEHNYQIDYPVQWEKRQSPPLDLILFAPLKPGALHSNATMNLISQNIGSGVTLDQVYEQSIKNLTSELKDVQIQTSGEAKLNGIPSKWVRYTHAMKGMKFTVLQYFILQGENVYLMTFSTPTDQYEAYRSDFENIASSFRSLSPPKEEKK
jgi:hypothetical protein